MRASFRAGMAASGQPVDVPAGDSGALGTVAGLLAEYAKDGPSGERRDGRAQFRVRVNGKMFVLTTSDDPAGIIDRFIAAMESKTGVYFHPSYWSKKDILD
jgi:hypothetical protein